VSAYVAGLAAGLALIVAIGAQNAFVLRQGLAREHVGLVVAICAVSDALLIVLGVGGVGASLQAAPVLLEVVRWVGVAYLGANAVLALRRALRPRTLEVDGSALRSRRSVALAALGFTYLNPHVYLDTVLLLGAIGTGFGAQRWVFAAGAATGSVLWFGGLGLGARAASRAMARPSTWRALDLAIAAVMLAIAVGLARTDLGGPLALG
jgi:L-lysine exporter family protein LysE/ArgO